MIRCLANQAVRNGQRNAQRAGYRFTELGEDVIRHMLREEPPGVLGVIRLSVQCLRYRLERILLWSVRLWPRWLLFVVHRKIK